MFDIGAAELLVIAIAAILVVGPKDLPMALRTAGRWMGQVRRMSNHFRAGLDAMIREAEMEDMERKWKERNAEIMRAHPDEMTPLPAPADEQSNPGDDAPDPAADDPAPEATSAAASAEARASEPRLPLEKSDDEQAGSSPSGRG
ncbi:MAG: twin-arginine translocase subunit TatB [Erythrobacter sp.]|nr:twin-arginine translocase subunit TatB [Erythrobacter sp.]NCQ62702.1 twin-arginine translocase subunit TatB [Alphaproteobacteria bacterium]